MADAAVRGYLGIIEVIVGCGGQINAINEVSSLPPSVSLYVFFFSVFIGSSLSQS